MTAPLTATFPSSFATTSPFPTGTTSGNHPPRFTVDGSAELEAHLARTCERIAAGVRGLVPSQKLEALLLGGGYGRGEGGVLQTEAGDQPYNDLEFYVCINGNRHWNERRFGHALHVLGEILTPQAGIEVEFRITSLAELRQGGVSMFSYDLVSGHRWLVGDESLLEECRHHLDAEDIPLAEATRLMMNRCSGLLLAAERLGRTQFTAADADFVARNIAKAQLGAGDAMLTAYGQYHWSVRERQRRFERLVHCERLPWLSELVQHHAEGTEFKLHPHRNVTSREALAERHTLVTGLCREVWLWLEQIRLGTTFRSVRQYVDAPINKCPHAPAWRNVLVNAKWFGPAAALRPRAWRHPRERVLNALALLLWHGPTPEEPQVLARVQRELRTKATGFAELVREYRELWARVN